MYTPAAVTAANRELARWPDTIAADSPARRAVPSPRRLGGSPRRRVASTLSWLVAALAIVSALVIVGSARATALRSQPSASVLSGGEQMRRQAEAVQAFRAGRYAAAYGRFAELADEGDGGAALIALTMLRHGPLLFGSEWSITDGQLERWSEIALEDVRYRGAWIAAHDRGE